MSKRLAVVLVVLLGAMAVSNLAGCATPRHRDWRQAVKVGDYEYAYRDLFESWRTGTVEVKAESLRHAWRDPAIIAVARKDLASIVGPAAERHSGDLASLQKAIAFGPDEDRVDFARLVDRNLDVDREIAQVWEKQVAKAGTRPAATAQPTAPAAPSVAAAPTPRPIEPAAVPKAAPPALPPATTPPPPPAPGSAPAIAPPAPPAKPAEPVAAPPAPPTPRPEPIAKPETAPKASQPPSRLQSSRPDAAHAELLAQAAQAKAKAVWRCKGAKECDKAWAAAEAFVGRNSDMRIQSVTASAIETYKPIVIGEIGMRVDRVAAGPDESEMRLTVACRAGLLRQACPTAELRIYSAFPAHMQSATSR
jgi:hypothetical protein